MDSRQDIPGNDDFEGVSGSRFYYLQNYVPAHNISSGITEDHIIAGVKRKSKPPARFTHGERDIPQLDGWKLRKKPRKSATVPDEQKQEGAISVIIPPIDFDYDSGDSPLTEMGDLTEEMDDLASDLPTDDAPVAAETVSEHPKLNNTDEVRESRLSRENGCTKCTGKMINLRHQAQQVALLRKEFETLQQQNNRLRAELADVRASHNTSTSDPTVIKFSADELLGQKQEINRLRRCLSSALELIEIARPPPSCDDAFVASTGFMYKEMNTLSNYVVYTADSLLKIRVHHVKDETISQDLTHLIEQTIVNKELLSTEPVSAFRALTFGFIQERVFYAPEIWRELHFDGIMFRQFQSLLEQSISPEALETYHRATVHLTLTKNPEFKDAFVSGYAEQIQFEFFQMMTPLIRSEDMDAHFKRRMRTLFRHALTLRANCYPHIGTRYQLVQFNPGHVYDPQTMRAEDEVGATVHVPEDGRQRRIKVCVHGLMKAYAVQENATGLDLIKELSQPFLLEGDRHGRIISDKAAVILE